MKEIMDMKPKEMLVVEPDYLPNLEICVSAVFTPHEDYTPWKVVHPCKLGGHGGVLTSIVSYLLDRRTLWRKYFILYLGIDIWLVNLDC